MHGLVDGLVAGSHDLREAEVADAADEEAGECGMEHLGPSGLAAKARAEVAEGLGEDERGDAADEAEDGVGDELAGVAEGDGGDAEHRLRAPEPAGDDDARDGGEDDGAEDGGAPLADDLFDDEEDGGDGGVEGGGEAGGGADGSEDAELLAGHADACG